MALSPTIRNLLAKRLPDKEGTYTPRRPEETLLYQVIQRHFSSFLEELEAKGKSLPNYVIKEFLAFLDCGILQNGFLRLRCADCKHEQLLPFSCKKRGFCPCCGGRRLAQTSILLSDHILPNKPIRQYVLSFPYNLRYLLATQPKLISPILAIVNRKISGFIAKKLGQPARRIQGGGVTLIQRFGRELNLNPHFHILSLDGAYLRPLTGNPKRLSFLKMPPPTDLEIERLTKEVATSVTEFLNKRGLIYTDEDLGYDLLEGLSTEPIDELKAYSLNYRLAFGGRRGERALSLKSFQPKDEIGRKRALCFNFGGFSLHAATAFKAHQRKKIERLIQYVSRPPLANSSIKECKRTGDILFELKSPYADGTTHIRLSPLELISRLAALVPHPYQNLIRYHGILSPRAKNRDLIIPKRRPEECPESMRDKPHQKYQPPWRYLLNRIFDIDLKGCFFCKRGELRILAAIKEPRAIKRILEHLSLPTAASKLWPPRGPPLSTNNFQQGIASDDLCQEAPADEFYQASFDDFNQS